jgi:hypothetical protein
MDCWVDRPGQASLAWWLIPAAVKPDVRESTSKGCKHLGAHLHPVFPARMLERGSGHSARVTLTATLLHPRNGEFVHPGEFEALKAFREEAARQRRLEEERRERHRRTLETERRREQLRREKLAADRLDDVFTRPPTTLDRVAEPPAQPATLPEPPVGPLLTCKVCGEQTRDWVVLYGSTGFCKCRNCAR